MPGTQTTDDAYPQADLTPIAAKVAGYVCAMPVEDYQRVHQCRRCPQGMRFRSFCTDATPPPCSPPRD